MALDFREDEFRVDDPPIRKLTNNGIQKWKPPLNYRPIDWQCQGMKYKLMILKVLFLPISRVCGSKNNDEILGFLLFCVDEPAKPRKYRIS